MCSPTACSTPTRLGELLDTEVAAPADGRERFGLMWAGKQDAVRSLLTPSRGTLVPELDKSIDFDAAQNVFIEGDNLEVLKLLQKAYNDRVKLIYIDPPYNTGRTTSSTPTTSPTRLRGYLEYTGQLDEEGNRTSASVGHARPAAQPVALDDVPALVLARNLLTQDGVIFVSIDDNEVANLRAAHGRDLRPENFVAHCHLAEGLLAARTAPALLARTTTTSWSTRGTPSSGRRIPLPRTAEQDARLQESGRRPARSAGKSGRSRSAQTTTAQRDVRDHDTERARRSTDRPPVRYWRVTRADVRGARCATGEIWFGEDGNDVPAIKRLPRRGQARPRAADLLAILARSATTRTRSRNCSSESCSVRLTASSTPRSRRG